MSKFISITPENFKVTKATYDPKNLSLTVEGVGFEKQTISDIDWDGEEWGTIYQFKDGEPFQCLADIQVWRESDKEYGCQVINLTVDEAGTIWMGYKYSNPDKFEIKTKNVKT